jgi:predicted dehydrogenase
MTVRSCRLAVIGCGHWGKNIVRNLRELDVLAMVCDTSPAGRDRAKGLAPEARVVDDPDAVFASDVDGVVVATPARAHHGLSKGALESGKDVFCEKPLALTYEEGAELVTLARKNGCILMVGHVLEYHPGVIKLIELVRSGELGEVRYITSNRLSLGKVRREKNVLWSFAPHDVAVILRLMESMPFQVAAMGGSYVQPNIADVTMTHLLFDNGVRAHIYVSWLHPFKEQKLVVVGSKKMASFDDVEKQLVLYDQHVAMTNGEPMPVRGDGETVAFPDQEPLRRECEAFIEAVNSRQPPLTDGTSGLRVLKVLQIAQRSLMTNGAPVALPVEGLSPTTMTML